MRRWRPGCRCDLRDFAGGRIDNGWPVRPYSVRRFTVSASQSPSRGPWHRIFGTPSVGVDDRGRSGARRPADTYSKVDAVCSGARSRANRNTGWGRIPSVATSAGRCRGTGKHAIASASDHIRSVSRSVAVGDAIGRGETSLRPADCGVAWRAGRGHPDVHPRVAEGASDIRIRRPPSDCRCRLI